MERMTRPRLLYILERWTGPEQASDEDVALCKTYLQTFVPGLATTFKMSVFVHDTFVDVVIKTPDPSSLLTFLRPGGTLIACTPWSAKDWSTVEIGSDSAAFMEFLADTMDIPTVPTRYEVMNDLQYLDVALYDHTGECETKIVFDKKTGMCSEIQRFG